ncbi:MAG: hypothetical protein ABH842_02725 [Candidatus Micrarchaeota archaeon]
MGGQRLSLAYRKNDIDPKSLARVIAGTQRYKFGNLLTKEPPPIVAQIRDFESERTQRKFNRELWDSAEQGSLERVKRALGDGAEINTHDELKETALMKAKHEFHARSTGPLDKLRMIIVIAYLKEAGATITHEEENIVNKKGKKETLGAFALDKLKEIGIGIGTTMVAIPTVLAGIMLFAFGGMQGGMGLMTFPFEIVYGDLKEFGDMMIKLPNIPLSVGGILMGTCAATIIGVGVFATEKLFSSKNKIDDFVNETVNVFATVGKALGVACSYSGFYLGTIANLAYIAEHGKISKEGFALISLSAIGRSLSRAFIRREENEKTNTDFHIRWIKEASRDLAIITGIATLGGAAIAYATGVSMVLHTVLVPAAIVCIGYGAIKLATKN